MQIELPQVGESVTEGVIGKWLKDVGDRVEKYDPLVEVITDKVTMEFPSPVDGVLISIAALEGETVPMGAVIADIEVEGADGNASAAAPPMEATAAPANRIGTLLRDAAPVGPTGSGGAISAGAGMDAKPAGAGRLSPAVARLAAEHGVDLSRIVGTGLGGRVTRKDVQGHIDGRESSPTAAEGAGGAGDIISPLTPVRRTIAENMVRSATEIPQAWTLMETDVTCLVRLREHAKEQFQRRTGVNLTYLPFVLRAVAQSLREHPRVNSSWAGDAIVLKGRVNLGVAVSTEAGLMVPVIHDADKMDVGALASAAHALASKARKGKLALSDVREGTFTVNNTGAFGSVVGKPLINPPQAAIMNSEAVVQRPMVVDDAIAIRSVMNLCLTFDHRVLDGAEAGGFLAAVKRRLEAIGPGDSV